MNSLPRFQTFLSSGKSMKSALKKLSSAEDTCQDVL